jgi:(S)-ureidoglycine aminohydrolase
MIEHRGASVPGSYTLVTPANHYPSRLPEFGDQPVVKLVTPRFAPSRIGEYLVSLTPGARGSEPADPGYETFCYALDGTATLTTEDGTVLLDPGAYAYRPAGAAVTLAADGGVARVLVLRRRPEPLAGRAGPAARTGHRDDEPFAATAVPGFTRRELLPVADPAFDFAMSLLRFDAGVGLANVEIHDEEHGLYLTEGGGTYLLGTDEHAVVAHDFIYMAPYCPQGFRASDAGPAEYLLYKDTWRDGFGAALA